MAVESEEPAATTVPVTPAHGLKRKHSAVAAPAEEHDSLQKRVRSSDPKPSGAVALHGINNGLHIFADTFREAMMPDVSSRLEASPVRKTRAIERVQKVETHLSDACVCHLVEIFQENVCAADTYLALSRPSIRLMWVNQRVKMVQEVEAAESAQA